MGEADPFIRFDCENCGYKSTVSESYAGKNIRCPNCYYIIFIPKAETTGATQNSSKHSAYDSSLLNIREQNILKHKQMREYIASEQAGESEEEDEEEPPQETDPAARRKAPWLIDIFLYPFNKPGLKNLAIFIGVPLLIDILWKVLPIQLSCLFWLVTVIVNILLFFYIYWYFTECVRDSADGWVRAPEGLGATPGAADMFWQTVNVIGCLAIFFTPFVLYMLFAQKADIIFWLLLIFAVFFYPIGLLAVVLFDSALGLNPRLLIRSISNTFFPYFGLVLLFMTSIVLLGIVYMQVEDSPLWVLVLRSVSIYIALTAAHILGRFYWRYQDKLNWEV